MRISKLSFKNIYGIKEKTLQPGDVTVISGPNGSGKTSILDAIATTLTNKNYRPRIIRNGEDEAEMLIETNSGLVIDKKKRNYKSDYSSVKKDGNAVNGPESYLKGLLNTNQINPLEFISMTDKQQAKILLSLTKIDFGIDDYVKSFDGLPPDYSEERHVLENLDYFQSKKSQWWKLREEENRAELFKRQSIQEEMQKLPENYDRYKWENYSISDAYSKIQDIKSHNHDIEIAETVIANADSKKDSIKFNYDQTKKVECERFEQKQQSRKEDIKTYQEEIKKIESAIANLNALISSDESKKQDTLELIDKQMNIELDAVDDKLNRALKYKSENEKQSYEELEAEVKNAEEMKSYLKLFDTISEMKEDQKRHKESAAYYDELINKARTLPQELLANAKMPIPGITIKNGELLINDLPIGNLSDGEQLELAMAVAKQQTGELSIILADGLEKLSKEPRERFLKAAKESGIQFFITQVTDEDEMNIWEV